MAGWAYAPLDVGPDSPMGGYAFRTDGAEGTHDPLEVHVLTLSDLLGRRVAIVVVDVVAINTDVVAKVRSEISGLRVDQLWISATHTHAGPDTGCVPGGSRTPQPWLETLSSIIVRTLSAAVVDERPTDGWWGEAKVTGVGGIRSGDGQDALLPVSLLVIRDPDTTTVRGVVAVIPCHPTVLGPINRLISSDLNGSVRKALQDRFSNESSEAPPWVTVATGAAGDISTRHHRRDRSFTECARLGRMIGDRILRSLAETSLVWRAADGTHIKAENLRMALPGRVLPRISTDDPESRDAAAALRSSTRETGTIEIEVSVIRFRELTLVAVPGELFISSAKRLAMAIQTPTLVFGYTNGYIGYFPPRDAFARHGYEVMVSPLPPGGTEELLEGIVELADRLALQSHDETDHSC